jgi:hypothetical protein
MNAVTTIHLFQLDLLTFGLALMLLALSIHRARTRDGMDGPLAWDISTKQAMWAHRPMPRIVHPNHVDGLKKTVKMERMPSATPVYQNISPRQKMAAMGVTPPE